MKCFYFFDCKERKSVNKLDQLISLLKRTRGRKINFVFFFRIFENQLIEKIEKNFIKIYLRWKDLESLGAVFTSYTKIYSNWDKAKIKIKVYSIRKNFGE